MIAIKVYLIFYLFIYLFIYLFTYKLLISSLDALPLIFKRLLAGQAILVGPLWQTSCILLGYEDDREFVVIRYSNLVTIQSAF